MIRVLTRCCVFIFCMILVASAAQYQGDKSMTEEFYKKDKRVALVIGNSAYGKIGSLKNAVKDAKDFAATLQELGFDVTLVTDATYGKIRSEIMRFRDKLNEGDMEESVGLFFYAGHGLQYDNENYIVPIDAEFEFEDDISRYCFPIQKQVLSQLEQTKSRMNIIVLDACRTNAFPAMNRALGENQGLGEMKSARGAFIAYATSPGSTASDGTGSNGLYTQELMKAMKRPGLTIEQVFKEVRVNVLKLSGQRQNPWENSNIIGDFYFSPPSISPQNTAPVISSIPVTPQSNTSTTNVQPSASRGQKKQLIVQADDKVRAYGSDNPPLTITYGGLEEGETLDIKPLISTQATKESKPGTYRITVAGGSDLDYDIFYNEGTLTITKAIQKISLSLPSGIKEGQTHVLRAIATSGQPVDLSLVSGNAALNGNFLTVLGPGIITIKASQKGNDIFEPAEFISSIAVATRLNLIVRAEDKTRPFGTDNPPLTVNYFGLLEGETLDRAPVVSTTATRATKPGTYPIKVLDGADGDYNFIYEQGTLTITKLPQKINFTLPAIKEGQPPVPLRGIATSNEPIEYSLLSGDATLTGNMLTVLGPGVVTIKASQKGNDIYEPAEVISSSAVKTSLTLSVRADDKTRPYGKDNPPLTVNYSGLLEGETLDRAPVATTTATRATKPGRYPIEVLGGADGDYNFNYEPGTLTITKLPQKINLTLPAMKEGQPPVPLRGTATSNEPVEYSLISGNATIANNMLTIIGPGPISIQAIQKGSDIYEPVELIVSGEVKAKMNLTAKADDKIRPYGNENPVFTVSYSGLMSGDVLKISPVAKTIATSESLPGTYPITVSGGSDDDYNIDHVNGTLTISKLFQAVSFFLPEQMLEGEFLTLSGTATTGEPVTYEVVSGNAKIENGQLHALGAGKVIVKAIQKGTHIHGAAEKTATTEVAGKMFIIARADDKTRPYDMENPPLTVSFSGMIEGHSGDHIDELPVATTSANKNSPPGSYEINLSGGSDDEYKFNYKSGTLTITKHYQNVSLSLPGELRVAPTPYKLTASSSSGAPVSYSLISGNATLINDQLTVLGLGPIKIKATQIGTSIYEPAEAEATTMAIPPIEGISSGKGKNTSKLNLIVKADDKSRPYGTKNPEFTVRYFGLKSGEFSVDKAPSISTIADKNSLPGTYPIELQGGFDDEYKFSYQSGTLTITKIPQSIIFSLPEVIKQGSTYTLSAEAASLEPCSFSLISGNAKVEGNRLIVTGTGEIKIKAFQTGNNIYDPGETIVSGVARAAAAAPAVEDKPKAAVTDRVSSVIPQTSVAEAVEVKAARPTGFDYGYGTSDAPRVALNTQEWFGKNLNVDYFNNGDMIFQAKTNQEWVEASKAGKPVWSYYNNDSANGLKFGKLYNWFAVSDPRGLCPSGWHVPSDNEWNRLAISLGDNDQVASQLKSTDGWNEGGNGTNSTGMNVLPGGLRYANGPFRDQGFTGFWWSRSAGSSTIGWGRSVNHKEGNLTWIEGDKGTGFSVRCLKD